MFLESVRRNVLATGRHDDEERERKHHDLQKQSQVRDPALPPRLRQSAPALCASACGVTDQVGALEKEQSEGDGVSTGTWNVLFGTSVK